MIENIKKEASLLCAILSEGEYDEVIHCLEMISEGQPIDIETKEKLRHILDKIHDFYEKNGLNK